MWNVDAPQPHAESLEAHNDLISGLASAANRLYTVSVDGELRIRNLVNGQELVKLKTQHGDLQSITISGDALVLMYSKFNNTNLSDASSGSSDDEMLIQEDDDVDADGITIEIRDLITGEVRSSYKHRCCNERPVVITERWIVFDSLYPQDPTNILAMRFSELSKGQEWAIDSGDPIDPGFYRVKTYVQGNKIIAVSSHGMIRVWDLAVLDKLRMLNRENAERLFTKLFQIIARVNNNEDICIEQCWKEIAALFPENQ